LFPKRTSASTIDDRAAVVEARHSDVWSERIMGKAAIGVLVFVLALPATAGDAANGLTLTGRGTVTRAPDVARFTFEVLRQGSDAAAQKREVDKVTAAVISLTQRLGIARDDVTAAVISVRPEYRYVDGRALLEGVSVGRTIAVTLRSLERYGDLTTGVVDAGVNQILGVTLDLADRAAVEREALDAAIANAAAEAAHVAAKLGLTLGRVLEVQIEDEGGASLPMIGAMMRDSGADFRPGTIEVSRRARLRYELAP
jgi:uncharacterized protein YggE